MNLPKNWWRRWDTHPGTIRWWVEYAIWRIVGVCDHSHVKRGWIRANENCDLAWECERAYVAHGIEGPGRKRE